MSVQISFSLFKTHTDSFVGGDILKNKRGKSASVQCPSIDGLKENVLSKKFVDFNHYQFRVYMI